MNYKFGDTLTRRLPSFILFYLWYCKHGSWISRFRNRYLGEDCFLLANGPSLNLVDLNEINNYHLIGLNKIYLLFDRIKLNLTFHIAINSFVIDQSWERFNNLECPSFLSYKFAKDIVPDKGNIRYILTEQGWFPHFSKINDRPVWEGSTVTYAALQMAYFMGFKNIFIVGLDHKFNEVLPPNIKQDFVGPDPNHFDPRYFSGLKWHTPDLFTSELGYSIARFVYQKNNRHIFDATINGACNIFEKISINKAFEIAKKRTSFNSLWG